MTATDELRRMLDERGVEWSDASDDNALHTTWNDLSCWFIEYEDGYTSWGAVRSGTPEQAIAATLGPDTCRDSNNRLDAWQCSECRATLLLMFDDFGEPSYSVDGVGDVPRFCPNCGRRVVKE